MSQSLIRKDVLLLDLVAKGLERKPIPFIVEVRGMTWTLDRNIGHCDEVFYACLSFSMFEGGG
jgi:hypothetical protein